MRLPVLLLSVLTLAGCRGETPTSLASFVARAHPTMGAEVRVTTWAVDTAAAERAIAEVFREFDRLDAMLSVWKPESDVLRINAAAGNAPVPVSFETREVLRMAHQLSEWTAGKFDITFGPLADIWKFDHDQDNRIPAPADRIARLPLVDYRAVVIDEPAGTAFLSRAGARIHLGGIGKGYAIDRAVAILRARGQKDFMVQAGGDLFVAGQPGHSLWQLGINDPRGEPNESFATVGVRDRTFSTSGDYERFFIQNGQRYHHLLDPDTGEPARGCVSVTIEAKTATLADGLSTGVFILGPEAGMALVERLPDVEAVIVTASNEVLISSGLEGRLKLHHPPTPTRP